MTVTAVIEAPHFTLTTFYELSMFASDRRNAQRSSCSPSAQDRVFLKTLVLQRFMHRYVKSESAMRRLAKTLYLVDHILALRDDWSQLAGATGH
jgi:hypothetical protein